MSKETDFKFHSATVGKEKGIQAGFDLQSGDWQAVQDIRKDGYRKMATIPDIVAIKILQDHNLDLHSPEFMHDPNNMKRLKHILFTEYRDILVNT
jgi:hypothetical protein